MRKGSHGEAAGRGVHLVVNFFFGGAGVARAHSFYTSLLSSVASDTMSMSNAASGKPDVIDVWFGAGGARELSRLQQKSVIRDGPLQGQGIERDKRKKSGGCATQNTQERLAAPCGQERRRKGSERKKKAGARSRIAPRTHADPNSASKGRRNGGVDTRAAVRAGIGMKHEESRVTRGCDGGVVCGETRMEPARQPGMGQAPRNLLRAGTIREVRDSTWEKRRGSRRQNPGSVTACPYSVARKREDAEGWGRGAKLQGKARQHRTGQAPKVTAPPPPQHAARSILPLCLPLRPEHLGTC